MTAVYEGSARDTEPLSRQAPRADGSPSLSSRAAARCEACRRGWCSDRELPELFRPRPTREDLRAIAHLDLHATAVERHELLHEVQVHDVRAVHADETLGIEPALEVVQR